MQHADEPTPDCPHCETTMQKWKVPQTPFTSWDNEFMYICFNDQCSYLLRGWECMKKQGSHGFSYRQMYNPVNRAYLPVPIFSLEGLKEGIVAG